MARTLYSTNFGAFGSLTVTTIIGTVPAGVVWVLRDVDANRNDTTGGGQLIILNQVGGALANWIAPASVVTANLQWRGRQVFEPGHTLEVSVAGGVWAVSLSGYVLTLP